MLKFFCVLLTFVFILSAAGVLPAAASDPPPPSPNIPQGATRLALPLVSRPYPYYITGQVSDVNAAPLAGVTITDNLGHTAITGPTGDYSLGVNGGATSVAPSLEGYLFSPAMLDLNVTSNVTAQDFTASLGCTEALGNTSFETGGYWNLLEGPGMYPSSYSTTVAHSGSRSVRLGIMNWWENSLSDSLVRSGPISIPASGTSASLSLWLYPLSSEASTLAPEAEPPDTDFGDVTLLYDAQFVRVLDAGNHFLNTLLYIRSNNGFWSYHTFDLSAYAGQTIKIEIGVYNDGTDGITSLYADDVSLQLCNSGSPPPPPAGDCTNQVVNSGFEYNGAWGIPYTPYPAGYSADYAYQGARSMRTGIPLYTYANVYSYSDAWQTVYIPAGSTSAQLQMWLFPRSQEAALTTDAEAPDPDPATKAPEAGTIWEQQPLSPDVPDAQYVLVLNPSTGAILETLLWWQPRNSSGWIYRTFNLSHYAGRSIRLQFGTYNNGYGGRTVMYVDRVVVNTCATPPPPPPPPPACSERISNGGFEYTGAWFIPLTNFSAGYSTALSNAGARSMRTGIVYPAHNRYAYSDFRQTVSIPAASSTATLRFYAYSASGEVYGSDLVVERPTSAELGAAAMAGDVQYLLVLDQWGYWIDTLLWRRSNERFWNYFQYNLNRFIGSTIQLQWGTYNNGWDGVTSMYVDDVSLRACP
ncbi:MAG: hypothetical protein A2W35_14265 [Chloroflexi bacterium RBG_16_57_11]|nr:MAG: hypothetical protein A2W35_14265 [Chloroflexi bacterium RBG_16_57_11]